jgi:hypothetical protein
MYRPGPAELNDPFEGKPHLLTTATIAEQRRYIAGLVNRTQPNVARAERRRTVKQWRDDRRNVLEALTLSMSQTLHAAGVFSLSADERSLLMWPHYADNHRGICIRFSMQALLDAGHVPFRVLYADERPTCDIVREPTVTWLNKAVLTKGKPWEYEQEWRIVVNRGAGTLLTPNVPVIDGVLLGANISPENRADVLAWVRESGRDMPVAQARFHPTAYGLEIDDLP